MPDIVYAPDELYKLYRTDKKNPVDDGHCRIRPLRFYSRGANLLLPEDRALTENLQFSYLMMEPLGLPARGANRLLIILHGLNEGSFARTMPWAYNFALRLNMPVIFFPLAFHMERRSSLWNISNQTRISAQRAKLPGNSKTSPFNGLLSERLNRLPERYYRGGLQSYFDMLDLKNRIDSGMHLGCQPGARAHFLGYSAGGYLALNLLLSDPETRFAESRAALFSSGAPLEGMKPDSLFIMDKLAFQSVSGYLRNRSYRQTRIHGTVRDGMERDGTDRNLYESPVRRMEIESPTRWLEEILFHGKGLTERLNTLRERLLLVVNTNDRVISADSAADNLSPVEAIRLDLGTHEFPFASSRPLPDIYGRQAPESRGLIREIRSGHRVQTAFQSQLGRVISEVSAVMS